MHKIFQKLSDWLCGRERSDLVVRGTENKAVCSDNQPHFIASDIENETIYINYDDGSFIYHNYRYLLAEHTADAQYHLYCAKWNSENESFGDASFDRRSKLSLREIGTFAAVEIFQQIVNFNADIARDALDKNKEIEIIRTGDPFWSSSILTDPKAPAIQNMREEMWLRQMETTLKSLQSASGNGIAGKLPVPYTEAANYFRIPLPPVQKQSTGQPVVPAVK